MNSSQYFNSKSDCLQLEPELWSCLNKAPYSLKPNIALKISEKPKSNVCFCMIYLINTDSEESLQTSNNMEQGVMGKKKMEELDGRSIYPSGIVKTGISSQKAGRN